MFEILVFTKSGTRVDAIVCASGRCVVGKDPECLVSLHGWKVAKQHAALIQRADGVHVQDLGSASGISVNGERIQEGGPLAEDDEVAIHSYRLRVRVHAQQELAGETAMANGGSVLPEENVPMATAATKAGPDSGSGEAAAQREVSQQWRGRIHR
jgi:pilus assembly protein CpaF